MTRGGVRNWFRKPVDTSRSSNYWDISKCPPHPVMSILVRPSRGRCSQSLLLNANEIVPTERIVEMVWGDRAPRTADHSVQIYISELRKALSRVMADDLIETRPPGYMVNVAPDAVDTLRFERLVRSGLSAMRSDDSKRARDHLEEALSLWSSDPLADFVYEEFAQGYIRSLSEIRSDALEALAALELNAGNLDAARERAREVIEVDPLREEPRRVFMLALYRSGRQAEALRHFADYRATLAEELGIEPSNALRLLEERILLGDPALSVGAHTVADANPYKGLRPFSESDADVYFGRESLVDEVAERLDSGSGFVSIVGPSGSGKSSAAQAGLMPRLRARGDSVELMQPGSRPLWELAGVLDRAGYGTRAALLRRFENDAAVLTHIVDRPLVLILDQFEELFTLAEPDVAVRFSELLAAGIRDSDTPLRVVATLRADYYDRPLSIPALAGMFSDSIVSVKPMTPQEIERAVVEPAVAAGVTVEPVLLAQLVADMGDEPGALPLLQFTLFELFERSPEALTLNSYEAIGGLHGALTGGADDLLSELDEEGRDLAEQLMMRMIRKGRALNTARPVPVRDLLQMGVDGGALQTVLEAFGSRRLITFDRDASGGAVVEIAHEFLISEWPQMESWIDAHDDDLDKLRALDAAAAEWFDAGKSEDYLLRGGRLEEFEAWRQSTRLNLTSSESQFLDASVEMRRRDDTARREQLAEQAKLRRSARRRLWYFGGAVAALAAAVTVLVMTLLPDPPPDVVASYCCRGGSDFGDVIAAGIDRGLEGTGLTLVEVGSHPDDRELLFEFAAAGTGLILTDGTAMPAATELLDQIPDLIVGNFECTGAILDSHPRMWCIQPSNHEIGFLAGAAAGLVTETDRVGIILGVDTWNMFPFLAGFEQGVTHTNPDASVDSIFLNSVLPYEDFSGFESPALGQLAASRMFEDGSDVIFAAAGYSNMGIHQTAYEFTKETGVEVWSIGADRDAWQMFDTDWWPDFLSEDDVRDLSDGIQSRLLTSILKNSDIGIELMIQAYARGDSEGDVVLSVSNGGMAYAYSGDHLEPYRQQLEDVIDDIASGRVVVEERSDTPIRYLSELLP